MSPARYPLPAFHGQAVHKPEGFPLEVSHLLSNGQTADNTAESARLVLVTGGTGHFTQKNKRGEVSTGFVVLVPPGVPFRFTETGDLELRVVCFDPEALHMQSWHIARDGNFKLLFAFVGAKATARAKVECFCLIPRIFEQALALVGEMEREIAQQLSGWRDLASGHFQHLAVLLSRFHELQLRTSHDSARRVAKAIRFLEKNYHEQIRMEDLAAEAAVSPRTFYRLFLQATGLTPNAQLKRVRMNHASEKLRLTDDTVTEIAYACGFTDSNFFSREFHRSFGTSPTHYRRIWQA